MLVDQNFGRGVEVTFFSRSCRVNPLLAQLARHIDCPIHGTRITRRHDHNRFFMELTEPIEPKRDAEGRVDVQGTMQVIMMVVAAWVREYPEAVVAPDAAVVSRAAEPRQLHPARFNSRIGH
jgi:KDO2-lipid IV(A) lauroyltransferase